jgi:hypothetical protein
LVGTRKTNLLHEESVMAVQPADPSKPESQPEKKKAETVQLSAEELRKIAGGATQPGSGPKLTETRKLNP